MNSKYLPAAAGALMNATTVVAAAPAITMVVAATMAADANHLLRYSLF